jgi:hypothetical protein
VTHDELDRLGPELEAQCNAEIGRRFPAWSRYAVDQMLDVTMTELAGNWSWILRRTVNGIPEIRLTQYTGKID